MCIRDSSYFLSKGNIANYENEEITSILNEVKNISDKDLLKEKYNRIIEIYEDEVPYICLYRNKSKVVYSIRVTGNINPNNYTSYYNFEDWYRQYAVSYTHLEELTILMRGKEESKRYADLAKKCKKSFNEKF